MDSIFQDDRKDFDIHPFMRFSNITTQPHLSLQAFRDAGESQAMI